MATAGGFGWPVVCDAKGLRRRWETMDEHIHTHSTRVRRADGTEYEARVYGAARADGTWAGWLEFHAVRGGGAILRTGQETSQPSRRALDYWAGGLEPVYIDGAFGRAARNRTPPETSASPPSA
jgi:hypothetical protein